MTDQELDQLMQRVLLDAIKSDCSNMSCEIPNFMPSHRYQHQMAIMIDDHQPKRSRRSGQLGDRMV